MVKVLLFQLFNRQNVVACEQEPVDTAVISDEAFLVATRQGARRPADTPSMCPWSPNVLAVFVRRGATATGTIQAYSAGEECTLMHQFGVAGVGAIRLGYVAPLDGYGGALAVVRTGPTPSLTGRVPGDS